MNKGIAIFLCDLTGIMAQPWLDAGYECWLFDAQHPKGITRHGNLVKVGCWLHSVQDVFDHVDKSRIVFVMGFPECTDLAVSGAAHFARKAKADPLFQVKAMALVMLCVHVGQESGAPWAFENPVSRVSTLYRKPDHIFHPWEYGGYLPHDDAHPLYPDYILPRDAYPKTTCLWVGNEFVMPPKLPVKVAPGYSIQHKKLGGKSLKTKNIRSATPRGFSIATYLHNAPHLKQEAA